MAMKALENIKGLAKEVTLFNVVLNTKLASDMVHEVAKRLLKLLSQ